RHFEGQIAFHQRLRPMKEEIKGLDAIAAANGIDVTEALGGDQRGARAAPFQHRVNGDCGAMQHFAQAIHLAMGELERVGDALGRIGWYGRGFRRDDTAVDAADEIREGSSDVDADDVHDDSFQSEKRRSIVRTSSFNTFAISASVPISANRGDGSNVSANSLVKWPIPPVET